MKTRSEKLLDRFVTAQAAPPTVTGIAGVGSDAQIRSSAEPTGDAAKPAVAADAPLPEPVAETEEEVLEPAAIAAIAPVLTPAATAEPIDTVPAPAPPPMPARALPKAPAPLLAALPVAVQKKSTTSLGTTYFTDDLDAVNEIVHVLVSRHKLKHPLRAKIGHSVVVGAIVHSILPTLEANPDRIVEMVKAYFNELAPPEAAPPVAPESEAQAR